MLQETKPSPQFSPFGNLPLRSLLCGEFLYRPRNLNPMGLSLTLGKHTINSLDFGWNSNQMIGLGGGTNAKLPPSNAQFSTRLLLTDWLFMHHVTSIHFLLLAFWAILGMALMMMCEDILFHVAERDWLSKA